MMIGVVMLDRLPKVLNSPPETPPASLGEVSETTAQPRARVSRRTGS
jgi:hypothetical protein